MKLTEYLTAEFTDMCEKATEIQDLWRKNKQEAGSLLHGSYVLNKKLNVINFVHSEYNESFVILKSLSEHFRIIPASEMFNILVWLPTQVDFQELMQRHYENTIGSRVEDFSLIHHFNNWAQHMIYTFLPDSLEIIWLAYVMAAVYGKKWGKRKQDWVALTSRDKKAFRFDH